MAPPRRQVTILAGLGCLAIVILAPAVFLDEITRQYHLFRLRSDPTCLRSYLRDPEGSPRRAAVLQYLERPEGRAALLGLVLQRLRGWNDLMGSQESCTLILAIPRPLSSWGLHPGEVPVYLEDTGFFEDTSRVREVGKIPDDPTLNGLLRDFLVGEELSLPEHPGRTFTCHDLESWQRYLRSRRERAQGSRASGATP